MHALYLSADDPADVRSWSGLVRAIPSSLERAGVRVTYGGPLRRRRSTYPVRVRQALARLGGHRYARDLDPGMLRDWGRQGDRIVAAVRPDVVVSPGHADAIGLTTRIPRVAYADATFADVHDTYEEYSGLSPASVRNGDWLSRTALQTFAMTCFAAPHAARSATEVYGADPARVRVVPFGANLADPPPAAEVERAVAARTGARPLRLLFLGVDWERKGGPLAVEVVRGLRDAGVEAELDVAGCDPVLAAPAPEWVRPHGFISKATDDGRARLNRLLADAHFLLLPTRAEAFGLVFAEANAFGVPALTRRVGGVPVFDGENGYAFPPDAGPQPYVACVRRLAEDPARYHALARSARHVFETRLNWDVAGAALASALEAAVAMGPPSPAR